MDLQMKNTPDGVYIECRDWAGVRVGPLTRTVKVNGRKYVLTPRRKELDEGKETIYLSAPGSPVELEQTWAVIDNGWHVSTSLRVVTPTSVVLNAVELLTLDSAAMCQFSEEARYLRLMEQGAYWGNVTPMFPAEESAVDSSSEICWVMADSRTGRALLIGFETQTRWSGRIQSRRKHDMTIDRWSVEFDGGECLLHAHRTVPLEDIVILASDNALDLLDDYGSRVQSRHNPELLPQAPVSWCSWYPYRLGVSEQRIVANAQAALERLKPLGLSVFVVDLGWEKDYLPSLFTENDQFPGSLKGLSEKLEEMGFHLGIWSAPTNISEFDPVAEEHPEMLVQGDDGKPVFEGKWFWHPHGGIGTLDLTHPASQKWLRENIRSLAERGARYLKCDFIGNLAGDTARKRFNKGIVAGGGAENSRTAQRIMREALREVDENALLLNCGAPEIPGPVQADLLYTCNDTGNTGYVGWHHLQTVFLTTATHLFKNHRWGIIQPSCLCVGLPGTLDEARVRATVAFMAGGQVDIGDDLTTLPEERWNVLLATLPPHRESGRAVDLFQPVQKSVGGYSTRDTDVPQEDVPEAPPASVWVMDMQEQWDEWKLVAVFDYSEPVQQGDRRESQLQTFRLPIERLGLFPDCDYWGYEFWSGQFYESLPAVPEPQLEYTHPGDYQTSLRRLESDILTLSFFGPGVKLLALRERKSHPWVVGTSFHQSCGSELTDVVWDDTTRTLSGKVNRPPGEYGFVALAGGDAKSAEVDSSSVPITMGSGGSVRIPVICREDGASWSVVF